MLDNSELINVPGRKYILYGKKTRNLLRKGYQLSEDEIPEIWLEDVNTCPCVADGNCEGVKDPEFFGRCVEGDMGYMDCPIFKVYLKGIEPNYQRKDADSEALKDTKIMHAEDLLPKSVLEGSVEDQVDEGLSISRARELSTGLRYSHHTGSYEEYDHSDQIDKSNQRPCKKKWR